MADLSTSVLIDKESTIQDQYLAFLLGKDTYAISIYQVKEMVGMQQIITIPEAPYYVKGFVNLRGNIIVVIDLRLRFGLEAIEYTDRTCIIIIEMNEGYLGLIVDQILEVSAITEDDICPPTEFSSKYIAGIGKCESNVRLLLDCQQLL